MKSNHLPRQMHLLTNKRKTHKYLLSAILFIAFHFVVFAAQASSDVQQKLIDQFKKSLPPLSQQKLQDFERVALQAKGDQALIAGRLYTFLEEALKLQKQSKESIVQARLQGLFWYCYRAGEYDLALVAYRALENGSSDQRLSGNVIRASQEASKKIQATKELLPQIAEAQKKGDINALRILLAQAEEKNPRSPEVMAYQEKFLASTAKVQTIINSMTSAFQQQKYAEIQTLYGQLQIEAAKSKGFECFVNEGQQILSNANLNTQAAESFLQKALDNEKRGFTIDAAKSASESLKMQKNNRQTIEIAGKYKEEFTQYNQLLLQLNQKLTENEFNTVRQIYQELARLPSSKKEDFRIKELEFEKLANEQVVHVNTIGLLLKQKRYDDALPDIEKWVPKTVQKEIGSSIAQEAEEKSKYELAAKYYQIAGDGYNATRITNLIQQNGKTLTAQTIFDKYANSIVFIRCPTDHTDTSWSQGSGFFISQSGHLLTNHHVVKNAYVIEVYLKDNPKPYIAKIVQNISYPNKDIALLKIDGVLSSPLVVSSPKNMKLGDTVFTFGNPINTKRVITQGRLAAKDQFAKEVPDVNFLISDMTAEHGNSGGPLLNQYGEAIGILSMSANDSVPLKITYSIDMDSIRDDIKFYIGQ